MESPNVCKSPITFPQSQSNGGWAQPADGASQAPGVGTEHYQAAH